MHLIILPLVILPSISLVAISDALFTRQEFSHGAAHFHGIGAADEAA
jgi:hypothetical protein